MNALTNFTLNYLLNSLWQVPLIFAAAWLATRALHRTGPATVHRIWVCALALEAVLPACSLDPASLFQSAWQLLLRTFKPNAPAHGARVTTIIGAGTAHGVVRLPAALLTAAAIAYACSVLYFAGRLAWGLWQTASLRRHAEPATLTNPAALTWQRCRETFAVPEAQLVEHSDISGPITIGIRRRLLLLPAGWLETLPEEDLDAALAHEFAHMRRRDFAKNLLYEALSLPIAYHPLSWLTRSRVAESREILCDSIAAEAVAGKQKYARSLLRLASRLSDRIPHPTLHAIGIFDANNFERRVMNLTQSTIEIRGIKKFAITAACLTLGLGTCASALALHINVTAPAAQTETQSTSTMGKTLKVPSKVMAANILTQVDPEYPPDARVAKITGDVVLHAVIGKTGTVERLVVVSGPKALQRSALDAARQWTYKPYLLNGNPMEVDTTITVNFQIF